MTNCSKRLSAVAAILVVIVVIVLVPLFGIIFARETLSSSVLSHFRLAQESYFIKGEMERIRGKRRQATSCEVNSLQLQH